MLCAFACTVKDDLGIPERSSKLDGWQGIAIKYGTTCPDCCDLVFPEEYGHGDQRQFKVLITLIRDGTEIDDVDCMRPVRYYALRHLLMLAAVKQEQEAALGILSPSNYGGFHLDGALAEEYAGEYQLVVLETFKDIRSILNADIEVRLSDDICSWLAVLGERSDRIRVQRLVQRLNAIDLKNFAGRLSRKCKVL